MPVVMMPDRVCEAATFHGARHSRMGLASWTRLTFDALWPDRSGARSIDARAFNEHARR